MPIKKIIKKEKKAVKKVTEKIIKKDNVVDIKENENEREIKAMFKAGLHFGHRSSKWNPHIKPYLQGISNNVHIFDLNKTYEKLQEALNFLKEQVKEKKTVLFIGTRGPERELVKKLATDLEMPYVVNKWIGGTFTNFEEVTKRLKGFSELQNKKKGGEFDNYTKKERLHIEKEYEKMLIKWGGIKDLDRLPDIIFVVNAHHNKLAIKEAKSTGISVIAIIDTNVDPNTVDYPLPANDDAITSIAYILDKVKKVFK